MNRIKRTLFLLVASAFVLLPAIVAAELVRPLHDGQRAKPQGKIANHISRSSRRVMCADMIKREMLSAGHAACAGTLTPERREEAVVFEIAATSEFTLRITNESDEGSGSRLLIQIGSGATFDKTRVLPPARAFVLSGSVSEGATLVAKVVTAPEVNVQVPYKVELWTQEPNY